MNDTASPSWLRRHAVTLGAIGAVTFAAVIFHRPLLSWFGGGDGSGKTSSSVRAEGGGLTIETTIEPDAPRAGKNVLTVTLVGPEGPASGAEVTVEVWMPAMGAMAEMRSTADVSETSPGVFRAPFELAMAGSWTLTITARAGEKTLEADYGLTVGTAGLRQRGPAQASGELSASAGPSLPAHAFAGEAATAMLAALDAYEAIRAALAADSLTGVPAASELLDAALRKAASQEDTGAAAAIKDALTRAASSAGALGKSASLADARARFAELSESLVGLAAGDPALMSGRRAFECPMWQGYARWIQPPGELANPYMGREMLTCGSEKPWESLANGGAGDGADPVHDPDDISHYTCSMHPWVKKDTDEESCPVCGMDLTPVSKEEVTEGIIRIDRERRQAFGVTTAKVVRRQLSVPIHAVGRVAYDERRLVDVTLKYKGWIERLFVEETGVGVKKGQALFEVYSPELFAAQHELILAAAQVERATTELQKSRSTALYGGARKRMRLWDLSERQIDSIIAGGKPKERLTIRSPASGVILAKDVVEGAAVAPGERLFRIADLDRVWVEAEIYEEQIPLVKKGQKVAVRLSGVAGEPLLGTVSFIHPALEAATRTARVRVELDNKRGDLKPEMFAEVDLAVDHGVTLVVPEAAILYSGPRRIVFVDIGEDRLRPTLVEIGVKSGGFAEVRSGLSEGDTVVVSGNFLVAAESRLKSATGIW